MNTERRLPRSHRRALGLSVAVAALLAWGSAEGAEPLKYMEETMPNSLHPFFAENMPAMRIQELLFEGLLVEAPGGGLEGRLAKRWSVAPDGGSVSFELRPDLKWHDGRPITADDVVFTVQAAQDPRTKFFGKSRFGYIRRARAEGERRVVFELREPMRAPLPLFDWKVLPRHAFPSTALSPTAPFAAAPIGSGPFRVVKASGKQIKMERFEGYFFPVGIEGVFMQQKPDR